MTIVKYYHVVLFRAGPSFSLNFIVLTSLVSIEKLTQCDIYQMFNVKARGAEILIYKDIAFQAEEVIADTNGRYVIVIGQLFYLPVILVNVYAPNFDDHNFFTKLFSAIPAHNNYNLIIAGDFNCVLNSTLDRSSARPQALTKSAKVINGFCAQSGLSDIWRFKYPK